MRKNEHEQAISCFGESLRIYRLKHGDDSLDVAGVLFSLGKIYGKRAQYDKAQNCFTECLRIRKAELGDGNAEVIAVRRFVDAIKRKLRNGK